MDSGICDESRTRQGLQHFVRRLFLFQTAAYFPLQNGGLMFDESDINLVYIDIKESISLFNQCLI